MGHLIEQPFPTSLGLGRIFIRVLLNLGKIMFSVSYKRYITEAKKLKVKKKLGLRVDPSSEFCYHHEENGSSTDDACHHLAYVASFGRRSVVRRGGRDTTTIYTISALLKLSKL